MTMTSMVTMMLVLAAALMCGVIAVEDGTADAKAKLLQDLTSSFRKGHDEGRLLEFEELLGPMYSSLPKNLHDNVGHLAARYGLHRFFVERHGWSIEGLAPVDAEREATPMSSLSLWMPDYLVASIEQLLGTNGVSLREMAVLAATFEDLIHREASKRLEDVYDLLSLPKDSVLHEKEAFDAIKVYMTMYTSGGNGTVRTKEHVLQKKGGLNLRTKKWLKQVQVKVAEEYEMCDDATGDCGRLDFKAATRVVEEISEQYRSFNEHECEDLSHTLEMEADSPGRVSLTDFYSEGLHGAWNFTETPEYLQALGALDSTPSEAHVLIPNYVASRPNCLATSSIYVVCCRSKCESMTSNLLSTIRAPVATPSQVVDALGMRVDEAALQGLHAVAEQFGGVVPLHGHALAQWLHETFPQTCPRPHAHGISHVQVESDEESMQTGVLIADMGTVQEDVLPEVISIARPETKELEAEVSHLVLCACLAACSVVGAVWASRGVLFEANGFLYTRAKAEKLRMPIFRLSVLSSCLVALVYALDKMACEAATASFFDVVLTVAVFVSAAAVGWASRKRGRAKPEEMLPL